MRIITLPKSLRTQVHVSAWQFLGHLNFELSLSLQEENKPKLVLVGPDWHEGWNLKGTKEVCVHILIKPKMQF